MRRIGLILVVFVVFLAGCSNDKEETTEVFTYSKVLGQWNVVSYLTSSGYFIPSNDGEYYTFNEDRTYTHYYGNLIDETESGTFTFDNDNYLIKCKEPRGWDFSISG